MNIRGGRKSELNTINEEPEIQSNVDLLYLSSSPLLMRPPGKKRVTFDLPLNIQKEIEELCKAISKTKKKFVFKSQVGTSTSLTEALCRGTKVLHISCHGNYKSDAETSLLFEPSQHD
jgi:CHAT domain-containing protein